MLFTAETPDEPAQIPGSQKTDALGAKDSGSAAASSLPVIATEFTGVAAGRASGALHQRCSRRIGFGGRFMPTMKQMDEE
jgi:hypothetical protein